MTVFTLRSMVASLAALVAASASAGAQPTYKHKAPVHQFVYMSIPVTATALVPAPVASVRTHETDGLSRNPDDCNYGCIDNN